MLLPPAARRCSMTYRQVFFDAGYVPEPERSTKDPGTITELPNVGMNTLTNLNFITVKGIHYGA